MTQSQAILFARQYLWNDSVYNGKNCIYKGTVDNYRLHGSLQYHLCDAYKRLAQTFGEDEVNKKDIAHFVNTWCLANKDKIEKWRVHGGYTLETQGEIVERRIGNHGLIHEKDVACS